MVANVWQRQRLNRPGADHQSGRGSVDGPVGGPPHVADVRLTASTDANRKRFVIDDAIDLDQTIRD
ncbi:MAG: hypothetical protein DMF84_11500 [Acidobacteria bacterium]|nr:MAG: hypothetical protein DMF84_11500 [Acidobacteriota bacterium]